MPHARAPHSEDSGHPVRGSSALTRFLSGLAAFSAGVFICGACSSYSSSDPSFNMAVARATDPATGLMVDAAPENMFGHMGAVFGDLLMQGFGWTAILLGFALMVGGVRRAFGIGQQDPASWMWGMAAILFAACCLAEWPIPKSWDMSAGLGGVVGEVMLAISATPFAALKIPDPQVWASALAGVCAILFAAMAMGLGASDASSLWRALTAKPQREPEAPIVGVPALASRPASSGGLMEGVMKLLGKKPQEVIEPIVYTEEDGFEEGDLVKVKVLEVDVKRKRIALTGSDMTKLHLLAEHKFLTAQQVAKFIHTETRQVMENIGKLLKAANMDFEQLVKVTILLSDMSLYVAVNEVYGSYFGEVPPAREAYAVKGLPRGVNVEISGIAVRD